MLANYVVSSSTDNGIIEFFELNIQINYLPVL